METLQVRSRTRDEWIDITSNIQKEITKKGLQNGYCLLFVPHTTAAVTINEGADPTVTSDILHALANLAPHKASYKHREGNADAHIKSTLVGVSALVPVQGGELVLGTWQSIFFCEFDGPRNRRLHLQMTETLPRGKTEEGTGGNPS